jgi:hypothetical protein
MRDSDSYIDNDLLALLVDETKMDRDLVIKIYHCAFPRNKEVPLEIIERLRAESLASAFEKGKITDELIAKISSDPRPIEEVVALTGESQKTIKRFFKAYLKYSELIAKQLREHLKRKRQKR